MYFLRLHTRDLRAVKTRTCASCWSPALHLSRRLIRFSCSSGIRSGIRVVGNNSQCVNTFFSKQSDLLVIHEKEKKSFDVQILRRYYVICAKYMEMYVCAIPRAALNCDKTADDVIVPRRNTERCHDTLPFVIFRVHA